ncbi:MAG: NAD(P)-binding domain-containing protein [Hyphomicrobiales bacterium]
MTTIAEVAIVGAGPYGLSIAAHLSARGLKPLIFGSPMKSWRDAMPRGMRLKSEGFASSLSDPDGRLTLKAFCESEKLPYADINLPVPVETFVAYGDAFQRRFVPQLDTRMVGQIRKAPHGFTLRLDDGAEVDARKVIVATGILSFRQVPEVLQGLSRERLSHTCEHADYSSFAGQRVVVIGAGASATDAAAALLQAGASVTLVCRSPSLTFYAGGSARGWLDSLIAPMTPIGPGWKKLLCVKAPLLFRMLPERLRTMIVQRFLGPAPCWFVREEIEGRVTVMGGSRIIDARETAHGVKLEIASGGGTRTLEADHVIAGTGFRVNAARLQFLDTAIASALELTQDAPRLSSNFESTVAGLHFVGTMAVYEFGPMLRFVCGADFTARRVANHIAGAARPVTRKAEDYRSLEMSPARQRLPLELE